MTKPHRNAELPIIPGLPRDLVAGAGRESPSVLGGIVRGASQSISMSEPEAGSDVGNLSCRAEKVDGGWLINGQKTWCSNAHFADRILLVGRDEVARLTDEITDVTASAGEHVLSTRLGIYHGVATKFRVKEGDVLELIVADNPDAVAPLVQGGFVKLEPLNPSAHRARLAELADHQRP